MNWLAIARKPQLGGILAMVLLPALLILATHLPIANAGLSLQTCVAADGGSIRDVVNHPDRFICNRRQTRFGPGSYWIRSQDIPRDRANGPHRVRSGALWQRGLALYALYTDGLLVRFDPQHDVARLHLKFRSNEIALPARATPLRRLYWHVDETPNLRGILVDPQLMTPEESENNELELTALYVSFLGLCVGLFCFNIALWVALRGRFQLAYCAMLATLGLYALAVWDLIQWPATMPIDNPNVRFALLLLALNAMAGLWFARCLFERHVLAGWVDRAIVVGIASIALSAVALVVLAPWHMTLLDKIHGAALATQLFVTVPILWRAWTRRSAFRWIFLLVWPVPTLVAWMRVSNTFHIASTLFTMRGATLMMLAIEALLSAVAVAHRIHLIGCERDEARAQETVARTLADVDPLTGLLNRRAFLTHAIGREGDQVLLLADIDHFKNVNDTIGHDGGDEVLRVFARALRAAVPPEALVSRFGGEEFAIIVNADADLAASDILDRLRAERMPFDLRVTASIGTCIGPLALERDWKTLYRNADRALFEAKASGRDRSRAAAMPARAA